jgi:AcrR family transcriptional regulator
VDVRSEILRVATHLFARRGFDGASVQQIAAEVGIRKPSLLYHFPSKHALRLAVLDEVLQRWHDVLPRLLMAAAGGEDRFSNVICETVGFFVDDPDRARLLVREILDRPDDMRERMRTHVRPWVAVVADYIRKGQTSGEVHADVDPEAYVLQVINMVVCGIAASTGFAGVLRDESGPSEEQRASLERHTRELIRIARFSLFTAPRQLEAPSSAEPRKGPEPRDASTTGG